MSSTYFKTRISCYVGLVVQAIVDNFLPILFIVFQTNYHLNYEQLGRIVFINFFTQIFADLLTPKIVKLFGYRKTAVFCQGCAAFGLILLAFLPRIISDVYISIIIPVIVMAFSSGVIEVLLSPMVEMLPTKRKAANMAFLHSFYCWGHAFTAIGTTLLVLTFGYDLWFYIPLFLAVIPLVNMLSFLGVPIIEPPKEQNTSTAIDLLKTREFFCFAVFMLCAGASEITLSEWASVFAQNALGIGKVAGDLLGPCAFAIFMGIGRIIFGMLSGRFSVREALIINNILCFACYLTVGICNIPALSLIACALCGFSVSLSWPGTYSLALAKFKNGGTLMFSLFALCGDLGCSFGPWLLGAVADVLGLNAGFIISAVFPAVMVITAIFFLKEEDCINE